METFLVVQGAAFDSVGERARDVLRAVMPRAGHAIEFRVHRFEESAFVCAGVDPYITDRIAVVSMLRSPREIALAFERGGLAAVRDLPRAFCAAVLQRESGKVHAIGDPVGALSLYYARLGSATLVSPHDLSLVAGGFPVSCDEVRMERALELGWSPGGVSFLRGVERVGPNEALVLDGQKASTVTVPGVIQDRIEPEDAAGLRLALDETVEAFVAACGPAGPTTYTLSAGIDSRAVLAGALASGRAGDITALSSGSPDDLDVKVARRLAGLAGVSFVNLAHPVATQDQIEANAELYAFACNGDYRESLSHDIPPVGAPAVAYGGGGEIYRGSSRSKFRYGTKVPFSFSRDPDDNADMAYMYERVGVWGKHAVRGTWRARIRPFCDQRVIRSAWRLPAPLGRYCTIHAEVIRRYFPKALQVPVNARMFVVPHPIWTPLIGARFKLMRQFTRFMGGGTQRPGTGPIVMSTWRRLAKRFEAHGNAEVSRSCGEL